HRPEGEQGGGEQEVRQVAPEDGGGAPDEVQQQPAPVGPRLAVDDEVGAGDEAVEEAVGGLAADDRLGVVEVGGGAAVEPPELDGLVVVEAAQAAALDALQPLLERLPIRAAPLDERGQVHAALTRCPRNAPSC